MSTPKDHGKINVGPLQDSRCLDFVSLKKLNERDLRLVFLKLRVKQKIEFSSHTGNLALMRKLVRRFLESYPLSDRQRTLMVLGVDEACTNVIRHAYHLRDDQLMALSLEGLRDCVRMRLRDYGRQTASSAMPQRAPDLIKPGGLGLHLIRSAFDRVDYILMKRGTELVLTKNLDR